MLSRTSMALAMLLFSSVTKAQLVYYWDFTSGSVIDSVSGVTALLGNPAGLSAAGYTFTDVGEGIRVDQPGGLAVSSTYTIELVFSLDYNDAEYQRLIDFSDFDIDEGMYAYDDYFYFYDQSPDEDTYTFSADEIVTLQLSRDGLTDLVIASLNGTEIWRFTDSNGYAEFAAANNVMHFFEDDSSEHPAGTVREIRVFASVASSGASAQAVTSLPFAGLIILVAVLGWLGSRRARGTDKSTFP